MASKSKRQKSSDAYKMMYGTCPDDECQAKLYFPSYDKSIECINCGQRHDKSSIKNVAEVTNSSVAVHNLLKNILLGNVKPKKGADNVKVLGLSNYVCKLLSPILTYYGMDRESGKAKKLIAMGKGEVFDVSILGDRTFVIEEEHLGVNGYGRDRSGSLSYLADTLSDIRMVNDRKENLVPIHADGDGHCLVHAISRGLVGRELFWHALRVNLKAHLIDNLDKYKLLFRDFVDQDEWDDIIDECDPYYLPPEDEALGMRNIHIFGLANVLHRPIILLDSRSGMNSSGDYSGVFLPGFVAPEKCKGKDGSLNKPLVIAWSSSGRNHYIPLVPVKGLGPAKLPKFMVQKAWGMPRDSISDYIEFDTKFCCSVGGDKCLTDRYLRQLVSTMEEIFVQKYEVSPSLVADVHQYIYKSAGIVGMLPNEVIERTQACVGEKKLFRCLMCEALTVFTLSRDQLDKGGSLYNLAVSVHKKLDHTKLYSFPAEGAVCSYEEKEDRLVLDLERSRPKTCAFCQGDTLRQVKSDGSVLYIDGDRTTTPCLGGKCPCGFKHFWLGKEYDNLPEIFPITLQWAGKTITEKIPWFQYESDPTLNSNVFEVAQALVQKHFPGEFGSERLVQRVVDSILDQSARALKESTGDDNNKDVFGDGMDTWSADTASKIILTGQKKKTIHKEELMMSEKEKAVRKQIVSNASKTQQKKTQELTARKSPQRKIVGHQHQGTKSSISKSSHSTTTTTTEPTASTSTTKLDTTLSVKQAGSGEKKVRLQTSDGRQVMLTLVKEVTYTELQSLIAAQVDVPPNRQKLRLGFPPKVMLTLVKEVTYSELQSLIAAQVDVSPNRQKLRLGFPPKVLEPEFEGDTEKPVKIHHGDKLALEVLPDPEQIQMAQSYPPPTSSKQVASWSSFDEETQDQNAERLLTALKEIQRTGDSIDTSVASLRIISELAGKDLWTYVQGMPHLFSVGGLLYNQVKRDLGLVDGKHCQLPCLPGKIFRYSSGEDRLELCLEPYGHFPVEPNIEQKVKDSGLQSETSTSRDEVKFGSSGAIHHGQDRKAFSGQGHSMMGADDRMPEDLACATHRPQVRGFHDLCSVPGKRKDSIPEESEDGIDEKNSDKEEHKYQRLGPGYSVLDPGSVNTHNANIEMFRALAESIEKTLTENMEQDLEEMAESIKTSSMLEKVKDNNIKDATKTTTDEQQEVKQMDIDTTTVSLKDIVDAAGKDMEVDVTNEGKVQNSAKSEVALADSTDIVMDTHNAPNNAKHETDIKSEVTKMDTGESLTKSTNDSSVTDNNDTIMDTEVHDVSESKENTVQDAANIQEIVEDQLQDINESDGTIGNVDETASGVTVREKDNQIDNQEKTSSCGDNLIVMDKIDHEETKIDASNEKMMDNDATLSCDDNCLIKKDSERDNISIKPESCTEEETINRDSKENAKQGSGR